MMGEVVCVLADRCSSILCNLLQALSADRHNPQFVRLGCRPIGESNRLGDPKHISVFMPSSATQEFFLNGNLWISRWQSFKAKGTEFQQHRELYNSLARMNLSPFVIQK